MNKEIRKYIHTITWKEIVCSKCDGKKGTETEVEDDNGNKILLDCVECEGTGINIVPDMQLEFTSKYDNFEKIKETSELRKEFLEFSKPYTKEIELNLIRCEKETKRCNVCFGTGTSRKDNKQCKTCNGTGKIYSDEYKYWEKNKEEQIKIASEEFILDKNRLKTLFEKTLDGEVDKINYECNTHLETLELLRFGTDVLTDFFTSGLGLKKKQING